MQVRKLEDLKGLKIMALGGPQSDMAKGLGAVPVAMGVPDVYPTVEKGVLDAVIDAWTVLEIYKHYEVIKYLVEPPITNFVTPFFIMNLDKWNSLSPDIQQAIWSVVLRTQSNLRRQCFLRE